MTISECVPLKPMVGEVKSLGNYLHFWASVRASPVGLRCALRSDPRRRPSIPTVPTIVALQLPEVKNFCCATQIVALILLPQSCLWSATQPDRGADVGQADVASRSSARLTPAEPTACVRSDECRRRAAGPCAAHPSRACDRSDRDQAHGSDRPRR